MSKHKVRISGVDALFKRVMAEHEGWLYRLCEACYPFDRPRRDALYNDVLYRVWRGLHSVRVSDDLGAWLFTVAANTAAEHRRRRKWQTLVRPLHPADEHIALDDDPVRQMLDELYCLIEHLGETDRRLVYLYLDEVPQGRIAELMGLSEANVSTRIKRIKDKLKKMHDEQEQQD